MGPPSFILRLAYTFLAAFQVSMLFRALQLYPLTLEARLDFVHHSTCCPELENSTAPFAYATFLAHWPHEFDGKEMDDDKYFVATRILAYQILHAPETRSAEGYPLIVLVNEHVSREKRERLTKDGAVVWEPKPVEGRWIHNAHTRMWEYVLTKFRIWELTQFENVLFMDADTILTRSLDDIFHEPATNVRQNLHLIPSHDGQPDTYALAGLPETNITHHWPPREGEFSEGYMNAGFFVTKPSLEMLDYYLSFTAWGRKNVFNPQMPEQNLLNSTHGLESTMPWQQLDWKWNVHYPSMEDFRGGVASMHAKWWDNRDEELQGIFLGWKERMEEFYGE